MDVSKYRLSYDLKQLNFSSMVCSDCLHTAWSDQAMHQHGKICVKCLQIVDLHSNPTLFESLGHTTCIISFILSGYRSVWTIVIIRKTIFKMFKVHKLIVGRLSARSTNQYTHINCYSVLVLNNHQIFFAGRSTDNCLL